MMSKTSSRANPKTQHLVKMDSCLGFSKQRAVHSKYMDTVYGPRVLLKMFSELPGFDSVCVTHTFCALILIRQSRELCSDWLRLIGLRCQKV